MLGQAWPRLARPIVLLLLFAAPLASRADLLVSSRGTNSILRYDETTGDYDSATGVFVAPGSGGLVAPVGMRFGPDGNLYVASQGTNQVLRYDGQTGAFIDVFASGPTLDQPVDVQFGSDGQMYVSNFGGGVGLTIEKFDGLSGAHLQTFASAPQLLGATGFRFGPDGDLYVCSFSTNMILKFDGQTGALLPPTPFASDPGLIGPSNLTFAGDSLYAVSLFTDGIYEFDATTGASAGALATDPALSFPSGIIVAPNGNLLVTSLAANSVLEYGISDGASLGEFLADSPLNMPADLVLTPVEGDANRDRKVTGADYTIWADHFGADPATVWQGDFNYDGRVTGADYTIWADNFGAGTEAAAAAVPEPASWLLAIAALLFVSQAARLRRACP